MSEPQDHAHFLHQPAALSPLVAIPVHEPRLVDWGPEGLCIATRSGELFGADTIGGTRLLGKGPEDPVALAAETGRIAVVGRGGQVQAFGGATWQVETPISSQVTLFWYRHGLSVCGDDAEGHRRLRLFGVDGHAMLAARLPTRTVVGPTLAGELYVARSLEEGLWLKKLGTKVPDGPTTSHTLRPMYPQAGLWRILGIGAGGALFCDASMPEPVTVRLLDLAAVVWGPADLIALGSRSGKVLIGRLRDQERIKPTRITIHEGPILSIAFSPDGHFLATVGLGPENTEICQVWSIESVPTPTLKLQYVPPAQGSPRKGNSSR